jgi:hypothetical protein
MATVLRRIATNTLLPVVAAVLPLNFALGQTPELAPPTQSEAEIRPSTDVEGAIVDEGSPRAISVVPSPGGWVVRPSGLREIALGFNKPVIAPQGSISVWLGTNNPQRLPITVQSNARADELLITLPTAVRNGIVTLVAGHDLTDLNSIPLDGELTTSEGGAYLPSGDGSPGGPLVIRFRVLAGDANRDRRVDSRDVARIARDYNRSSVLADLDSDGLVNDKDLAVVMANLGSSLTTDDGVRPELVTAELSSAGLADPAAYALTARFTEPVVPARLTPDCVFLTDDAEKRVWTPVSVIPSEDPSVATFFIRLPEPTRARYRVGVSPAIADAGGLLLSPPASPFMIDNPSATAESSESADPSQRPVDFRLLANSASTGTPSGSGSLSAHGAAANRTTAQAAASSTGLAVEITNDFPSESTSRPELFSGEFTITRPSTAGALEVKFTLSGTATPAWTGDAGDYILIADSARLTTGSVTFVDGEASKVITIRPIDDRAIEPKETVILTLKAPRGVSLDRSRSKRTMSLVDNEPAVAIFQPSLRLITDEPISGNISNDLVPFRITHESAATYQGPDAGGYRSLDPVEVFLSSGVGGAGTSGTKGKTATWGDDYEIFVFDTSSGQWQLVTPGATKGVKLIVPPAGLDFYARALPDRELEAPLEELNALISSFQAHVLTPFRVALTQIEDNEPLITISEDNFGNERAGERRAGQTRRDLFVRLGKQDRPDTSAVILDGSEVPFTLGGTADVDVDYRVLVMSEDSLTWTPLGAKRSITVHDGGSNFGPRLWFQIIDDTESEETETITITIQEAKNLQKGSHIVDKSRGLDGPKNTVKFSFLDNDTQEITGVISSGTVIEGTGEYGTFVINRSSVDTGGPLLVPISITGSTSSTVVVITVNGRTLPQGATEVEIPAGQSSVEVRVTVVDDSVNGSGGKLRLTVAKSPRFKVAKGAVTQATMIIKEDDLTSGGGGGSVWTAQIASADPSDPRDNGKNSFRLIIGVLPPKAFTLRLKVTSEAVAGVDYSGIPTEVRFEKGESIQTKVITFNHNPFLQFTPQVQIPVTISIEPQPGLQLLVPSLTYTIPRR